MPMQQNPDAAFNDYVVDLEKENERLRELLADSALYIGRMSKIVEGYNHPSRIHKRAMAFYEKELRQFARTIHAKDAQ